MGQQLLRFLTWCSLWCISVSLRADEFPPIINTQKPGEEPPAPQEAVDSITVPEGFKVTLFAGEPDVQQPVAFDIDDRGRLWVAEFYTFAVGPYDAKHRDRVVILHDTDGDGSFDERKVFWDGAWVLSGLTWGFGGLWILNNGTLSFIPDRNGDDVPDSEPEVILDGWTLEANHNVVSGLLWGPDGWLYGRHGISATSHPGRPGTPWDRREPMNCGIWRFHPIHKTFDVVCNGTTNPWGLDYDADGQLFFTNNVTGHLWHAIPGAHYTRMFGTDFNPHLYALIDQHADHYHWDSTGAWGASRDGKANDLGGGHSHCGGMIYLGDSWPEEYRGSMFMCNLHGSRVNRDTLRRHGSGYVGEHADDFLLANQPWFRGVQLAYGPDGDVYLSDWTDKGECHDNDGLHRRSGRIYKITYEEGQRPARTQQTLSADLNLAELSSEDLTKLVTHKNAWFGRHARRLLQERALAPEAAGEIHRQLHHRLQAATDTRDQLALTWALHAANGLDEKSLLSMLDATDPGEVHIRVWGIRLLYDQPTVSPTALARFQELARSDPSALVRLTLASALGRLPLADRWPIARNLAAHAEDTNDHNLPLMIWYGIEPAVPHGPTQALEVVKSTQIPLLAEYIARRITADLTSRPESMDQLVEVLGRLESPQRQLDLLRGMATALRGWRKAPTPATWVLTRERLLRSPDARVRKTTQELAVLFGDGVAQETLRKIAANRDEPPASRHRALTALIAARPDDLLPLLLQLVGDGSTRITPVHTTALRGLAAYDNPGVPEHILKMYPWFPRPSREEAVNTLATRPASARLLLKAVGEGRIHKSHISAYQARQMASLRDEEVLEALTKVWGAVRQTPQEKARQIEGWKARLTPERLQGADLSRGRLLYKKACASCHRLYGDGGRIGPDITGSDRHNLDYLLLNILDPSGAVATQFTISVVVLTDGRIITGVIGDQTEQTVAIQTAQEQIVVRRDEIEDIQKTTQSLMPDGLLDSMREADVRKLFAYLQGHTQVPLPESVEAEELPSTR